MNFIKKIPIAMSGLALGFALLGNLLSSHSKTVQLLCGGTSAILIALVLLRLIFDTAGVKKELDNPIALSVFPTFFMALLFLSVYLKSYAPIPALVLWWVAFVLQLVVVAVFIKKFVLSFSIQKVFPSWFIISVGYVVVAVTSPAFQMQSLGRVLVIFGLVGYVALLPIVLYRVFKVKEIPEPALPTIAVFAAPASLCLTGYLATYESKSPLIVFVLLFASVFTLLCVLWYAPSLLRLKFYPTFSALTFPLVVSAVALKQANVFLNKQFEGAVNLSLAVSCMEVIATGFVLYVFVRYTIFLCAPVKKPN